MAANDLESLAKHARLLVLRAPRAETGGVAIGHKTATRDGTNGPATWLTHPAAISARPDARVLLLYTRERRWQASGYISK